MARVIKSSPPPNREIGNCVGNCATGKYLRRVNEDLEEELAIQNGWAKAHADLYGFKSAKILKPAGVLGKMAVFVNYFRGRYPNAFKRLLNEVNGESSKNKRSNA